MIKDITKRDEVCRLLVVGSSKARLRRIFSSLCSQQMTYEPLQQSVAKIRIEYLPCVATFASYTNESNINIRYLESVEYFPHSENGELASSPSSLLHFFDEVIEHGDDSIFPCIAGVAIGSGIEGPDDTKRIDTFIKTILSGNKNSNHPKVKTIEPNSGYSSMSDELAAYKSLSDQEKDEVNRLQTMGPEKMVKFVTDFVNELIRENLLRNQQKNEILLNEVKIDNAEANIDAEPVVSTPRVIDPTRERYFCRMCRTSLFGEEDLQDPPHETSRHQFSRRKMQHSVPTNVDCCQSFFLHDSLEWMGTDIRNGVSEGKFNCPKCAAKLGSWIWSGTQCSCGTWVVPAIQIPKSKVDVVKPITSEPSTTTTQKLQENSDMNSL